MFAMMALRRAGETVSTINGLSLDLLPINPAPLFAKCRGPLTGTSADALPSAAGFGGGDLRFTRKMDEFE
jgi:hypothetical protein